MRNFEKNLKQNSNLNKKFLIGKVLKINRVFKVVQIRVSDSIFSHLWYGDFNLLWGEEKTIPKKDTEIIACVEGLNSSDRQNVRPI